MRLKENTPDPTKAPTQTANSDTSGGGTNIVGYTPADYANDDISKTLFFTVVAYYLSLPPLENFVDLPVRKTFFGTCQKRYIDHHLFMSFSLRECISR